MTEPIIRANEAALQIFQQIADEMKEVRKDTRDLRERMIRLETLDFLKKIENLENSQKTSTEKIHKLENDISNLKTRVAPLFTLGAILLTIAGNFLIRAFAQ